MTDQHQHRATPEQMRSRELLHLRRIEALEAIQHAHIEANAQCEVTQMRSRELLHRIEALEATQHAHIEAKASEAGARELTLVERVADAIGAADDEGLTNTTWSKHSRAAIRAVAEWLRAGAVSNWGLAAVDLLHNEASR